MNRRRFLTWGLLGTAVLAVGGTWAVKRAGEPARTLRLPPDALAVLRACAIAILGPSLPPPGPAREAALDAHAQGLHTTVGGFPAPVRAELHQALTLLATAPGRRLLTGLSEDWAQTPPEALHAALQAMRVSPWLMRRQLYQALHALTNAAWFADEAHWGDLGYPGPQTL